MDYDLMMLMADFIERGGKVKRIAQGKRAMSRSYMRDVTGDDDRRAMAQAREDYRKERRAMRRKSRKARAVMA